MSILHTTLARPALLPSRDPGGGLPAFLSVAEALAAHDGDDCFFVLYPQTIAAAARTFLEGFPGRVLYAVKANPHPSVLQTLWAAGLRAFDVASIREVEQVRAAHPDAHVYFMHPVKSRAAIRRAYALGVRDFAFDSLEELAKIAAETGHARDLALHLRVAVPTSPSAMPLAGKFGANADGAPALFAAARPLAARLGVTFHVGSQCLDPDTYAAAIGYVRGLVDAAGVAIDSLDVGGGFPVAYPGMTPPPMVDYFSAIRRALRRHGFDGLDILGEPGRALCAQGGSTVTRVDMRRGHDLYLNEGTYGSLFDAGQCGWKFPVRLLRDSDGALDGFRFFGPTCDSLDSMAGPFHLPGDVREGDWIEIGHLGAYGQAIASRFNGFHSDRVLAVMAPGFDAPA